MLHESGQQLLLTHPLLHFGDPLLHYPYFLLIAVLLFLQLLVLLSQIDPQVLELDLPLALLSTFSLPLALIILPQLPQLLV